MQDLPHGLIQMNGFVVINVLQSPDARITPSLLSSKEKLNTKLKSSRTQAAKDVMAGLSSHTVIHRQCYVGVRVLDQDWRD